MSSAGRYYQERDTRNVEKQVVLFNESKSKVKLMNVLQISGFQLSP